MKNKAMSKYWLFLIAFIALGAAQETKCEKNFLWKVTSEKSTVYLLGSVHLMKPEIYPLSPVIENAYKSCNNVVFEVDMDKVNPFAMLKRSLYQDTGSLEKNISADLYEKLQKMFEKHNIKKETYNKYKPWFAVMNLLGLELMKSGFSAEYGIDQHFMTQAKTDKKKVLELESFMQQIELMEYAIDKYAAAFMDFSLMDYDQSAGQVDDMVKAWKLGNAEAMEKAAFEEAEKKPEFDGIMKLMIDERNFKMADKIKTYLQTADTYFVVVGSGHIIGKNGLLKLLGTENYKIEQM